MWEEPEISGSGSGSGSGSVSGSGREKVPNRRKENNHACYPRDLSREHAHC